MAIKAQVPVVPVALAGTRRVMEKGDWRISPGHVTVRVGEPIPTAGLALRDRDRLSAQVREAVLALREAGGGTQSEAADGKPATTSATARLERTA